MNLAIAVDILSSRQHTIIQSNNMRPFADGTIGAMAPKAQRSIYFDGPACDTMMMPAWVESALSWAIALGCLSVSGYHYIVATHVQPQVSRIVTWLGQLHHALSGSTRISGEKETRTMCRTERTRLLATWIPLTTTTAAEASRKLPLERLRQLEVLLVQQKQNLNDSDAVVAWMRSHAIVRRLATLALRPAHKATACNVEVAHTELGQFLIAHWATLLQLPASSSVETGGTTTVRISVVMPCYREDGAAVQQRLKRAQEHAQYALHVEIVIVDAGQCRNMQALPHMTGWAHVQVLRFADATGRGPCLNFGARHARGRILVFCHSDTQLPPGWDVTVRQQFRDHPINGHNVRTSACAFAFDINTTSEGLQGGRRPPGLDAIKLTANLRCRWWKLPYGDQCLCLPATAFAYLGGFPHQCIMEDYELVSLLRLRMTRLGSFSNDGSEHLTILPGPPAACSPRRWQSLGVPYVTVTNSRLVNAYAGGATPEHIYRAYYGHDPIVDAVSPWELKLEQMWANNPAG